MLITRNSRCVGVFVLLPSLRLSQSFFFDRTQNQLDKMKRKIMLGPNAFPAPSLPASGMESSTVGRIAGGGGGDTAMANVVNDMEANKVCSNPLSGSGPPAACHV